MALGAGQGGLHGLHRSQAVAAGQGSAQYYIVREGLDDYEGGSGVTQQIVFAVPVVLYM